MFAMAFIRSKSIEAMTLGIFRQSFVCIPKVHDGCRTELDMSFIFPIYSQHDALFCPCKLALLDDVWTLQDHSGARYGLDRDTGLKLRLVLFEALCWTRFEKMLLAISDTCRSQSRESRSTGKRTWDFLEPCDQSQHIRRGRREHMLQMRLGQSDVTGATEICNAVRL